MKKNNLSHIISIISVVILLVLGLACASEPVYISYDMIQRYPSNKLVIISTNTSNEFSVITNQKDIDILKNYREGKILQNKATNDLMIQLFGRATRFNIWGYTNKKYAAFNIPDNVQKIAIDMKTSENKSGVTIEREYKYFTILLDPNKTCEVFIVQDDSILEVLDYENINLGDYYLDESSGGWYFIWYEDILKHSKKK